MTAAPTPAKPTAERIRDVTGNQPVMSGAKLVKALRASGTPDTKLQPARDLFAAADKKDVPAAAVVQALEAAGFTATAAKASGIATTGQLPVREAAKPIEDLILEAAEDPPAPPKTWKADAAKK